MPDAPQATHWTDAARARHFIVPDAAELPPGDFVLRTATGRERPVDESALLAYEVTEDEARAWAKAQLATVFGEMREQTLGFVERLREKTAELREENRRSWEQAVADAPPEVREAGAHLRDLLKDLGATLRQAAREHGAGSPPPDPADAPPGATPAEAAPPASTGTATASAPSVDSAPSPAGAPTAGPASPDDPAGTPAPAAPSTPGRTGAEP